MRRIWFAVLVVVSIVVARDRLVIPTHDSSHVATITGLLSEPSGTPLAGRVELLAFAETSAAPAVIAHATAGANGRYTLRITPPAATYFALRASARDHATVGRQLELSSGGATTADLILPSDRGSLELVAHTRDGAPVLGAQVVVTFVPRSGDTGALVVFAGATDDAGAYALDALPPTAGTIRWSVRKTGGGRAFGERDKPRGTAPVQIATTLHPGLVLDVAVTGTTGAPVPGVVLELGESDGPWAATRTSDARGVIAFADVPRQAALELRVRSNHVLDGGYDMQAIRTGEADRQHIALRVQTARRISGHVRDDGGRALAGVTVNAQAADRDMGSPRRATTDANGAFEIVGLRDGATWDLDARHPSYAPAFAEDVAGDHDVELVLASGGGMRGRIVDDRGGAYDGVEIYVHRVEQTATGILGLAELASTHSAADGTWQIAHVNPGTYRVEVRSGARMQWQPLADTTQLAAVAGGAIRDLGDIAIVRGARLEGLVATTARTVDVAFLPRDQGGAPHVVTTQVHDGRFVIDNLARGDYAVTVRDPVLGYSNTRTVGLPGRETFAFAGTGVVSGAVHDAGGQPIARAEVDIYLASGGSQRAYPLPTRAPDNFTGNRAFTDDDGRYVVRGLAPGRYRVRITSAGAGVVGGELEVTASVVRDWVAPRPATIEVDTPATIVLVDSDGPSATPIATSGTTDGQGHTRIDNLPAGRYRVRAVAPGLPEARVTLAEGETSHLTLSGGQP